MADMGEIGRVGLADIEFLTDLNSSSRRFKVYREMLLNSPVVSALLTAIEQSVRSVDWQFTSDQGDEDERTVFLQECLDGMSLSWADHVTEALTFLPFGWSLFEIVYERDPSGRIVWRKLAPRAQDSLDHWMYDDAGGLAAFTQRPAPDYKLRTIPIDKLVLYRTRVERNNPEGRSILRAAYLSYYYAKNIQQIEAIGIERDLAGLPVIKLPPGADTSSGSNSDATLANKLVRRIRQDEEAGVVLTPGWELELLSTGGSRQFDTDKIISRYENRILMSALAQFLMLGAEGVGSLALSRDQTDLFTLSVNTTADIIADTFGKYAVPRLLELNGMDPEGVTFSHSPAGDVDITQVAEFLSKVSSFITWTPADEVWLRQIGKLPEIDPLEIEAERERKQQVSMALAQSLGKSRTDGESEGGRGAPPAPAPGERMGAELYASGPPDDAQRVFWEGRYRSLVRTYLAGQQKRVIRGVKGISRG